MRKRFWTHSVRQQDSQIAYVVAGRPGHDRVSQGVEQRIRIESSQRRRMIECGRPGSFQRASVGNGAGGGAIAIDAVRSRAQHSDVLASNFLGAVEHKMLVPSTRSAVDYFHGDLSP